MNIIDQLKIHLLFLLERNWFVIETFSFTVLREWDNSVWVGDWFILNTKDSSPHTVATIYPFGKIGLIWKGTLTCRLKLIEDFLDSHTPFLRTSVINTQEYYRKCNFGDSYQFHSVNLQVATEIKSNPFLVYLWTQSLYTSPSFPLVRKENDVTFISQPSQNAVCWLCQRFKKAAVQPLPNCIHNSRPQSGWVTTQPYGSAWLYN